MGHLREGERIKNTWRLTERLYEIEERERDCLAKLSRKLDHGGRRQPRASFRSKAESFERRKELLSERNANVVLGITEERQTFCGGYKAEGRVGPVKDEKGVDVN